MKFPKTIQANINRNDTDVRNIVKQFLLVVSQQPTTRNIPGILTGGHIRDQQGGSPQLPEHMTMLSDLNVG